MRTRRDGGPVFPTDHPHDGFYAEVGGGLKMRDYFAAQALQGILSAEAHPEARGAIPVEQGLAAFVAKSAYEYADAMLAERAK